MLVMSACGKKDFFALCMCSLPHEVCLTCTWKRSTFTRPSIVLDRALGERRHRARALSCNTFQEAIAVAEIFLETFRNSTVEFLTRHLRYFVAPLVTAHFPPLTIMEHLHSPRAAVSSIVQPDWFWKVKRRKPNNHWGGIAQNVCSIKVLRRS